MLLVEDNPMVLRYLADDLSLDGYQILTAPDGESALALIEHDAPDVVVLDVGLPGMDGIELCHRIRSSEATRFLPVILVTGHANQWRRGIEAGANEFLEKPVDTLALSVRVRTLMRSKQLFDEVEANQRELEARVEAATHDLREALQRVEDLSKVKGNVLQLISHEFGTPLHQAELALDVLEMPGIPEEFKQPTMADLRKVLQELKHRVQDALAFSDPTAIEPGPVTARDLIEGGLGILVLLDRSGLERVQLHITHGLPPVRVDQRRMTRVLAHLIDNAVRFGSMSPVDVIAEPTDEGCLISVRDYGEGLPPDRIDRLFEPLTQGDASSTRAESGLGLGLTLSRVTLDAHGIDLRVDTEPGEGTLLSFVLPYAVF